MLPRLPCVNTVLRFPLPCSVAVRFTRERGSEKCDTNNDQRLRGSHRLFYGGQTPTTSSLSRYSSACPCADSHKRNKKPEAPQKFVSSLHSLALTFFFFITHTQGHPPLPPFLPDGRPAEMDADPDNLLVRLGDALVSLLPSSGSRTGALVLPHRSGRFSAR